MDPRNRQIQPSFFALVLLLFAVNLEADTFQADTSAELIRAAEQARSHPGRDLIALKPNKVYTFNNADSGDRVFPNVTSELRIEGNGATLRWGGQADVGFFFIPRFGRLELDNLTLAGARDAAIIVRGTLTAAACRFEHNRGRRGGALRVHVWGEARISNCSFTDNVMALAPAGSDWFEGAAIFNGGILDLRGSTFVLDYPADLKRSSGKAIGPLIRGPGNVLANRGSARLVNVTLVDYTSADNTIMNAGRLTMINNSLISAGFGPRLYEFGAPEPVAARIGNSVLSGCPEVQSLGRNFFVTDGDSCNPAGAGDRVVDRSVTMFPEASRGLLVAKPYPGSPIVDAGSEALCPETDALGRSRPIDGDVDGMARCDVGAVEFKPGPFAFDQRMTGLWYEPARDGHYFVIEQPRPGYIVVFWAAYDAKGDPMWLYGSGAIEGDHTEPLTLYRQSGMEFPRFDRRDLAIQEWGTLQLRFTACNRAVAEWDAKGRPELDGSAKITHLAYVAGRECIQAPESARKVTEIVEPWLSGTWYDTAHNGHYVSTIVLPDERGTFAVWWTYTPAGEQLWLYGVADETKVGGPMNVYASRGMALPGLDTDQRRSISWGKMTLDFESCGRLNLSWTSDQPGFASGHAALERLTGRDLCD